MCQRGIQANHFRNILTGKVGCKIYFGVVSIIECSIRIVIILNYSHTGLFAVIAGFFMDAVVVIVGSTRDVCGFDKGFAVSNRIDIVVIAEPLDGTLSRTDCN